MDSSELALLLGLIGGVGGGYFGGQRREAREDKRIEDQRLADYEFKKLMRDEDREYQKQLEEEEKQRAIEEDESKFTIGDIFDPGNIFSQGISYDDMSPTDIALTASMLIPGLGLAGMGARGALAAARAARAGGLGSLGSKMMGGLRNYFSGPTGTGPSVPAIAYGGMNQGGRVGLAEGSDERGVIDRARDVGADFITRLRRGVVRPEDYDPGFTEYFNPLDFIGTFNEATGLQRLLMGPDQQADQRVLDILGTLNPNYDPDVVGTGDILDPMLMQMYGFPQDTRGLGDD